MSSTARPAVLGGVFWDNPLTPSLLLAAVLGGLIGAALTVSITLNRIGRAKARNRRHVDKGAHSSAPRR